MSRIFSLCIAIIIDFIVGDPYSFPHPVKLMGKIIRFEDKIVRKVFTSKKGLKFGGFLIVLTNILLGFFVPYLILKLVYDNKILYNIINIYLMYACIAAKSLSYEAKMVKKELVKGIEEGRKRVGYIVGRETKNLTEVEIIKATIETVAENTADGIIAPIFYIALLGAPGGVLYKFVNTMDSMLGYLDEKYIDIGHYPANNDDVFNYIPARLTAIFMLISSVGKYDVKRAFHILKRDHKNHKSPNAGFPESTVAGLLGIQLGGDNFYNGILVKKPTMGDKIKDVELTDIDSTVNIMYRSELIFAIILIIFVEVATYIW